MRKELRVLLAGLALVGLAAACGNPASGNSGGGGASVPVIRTVVGNGTPGIGGWNVPATGSTLSGPLAVVRDGAGNLFVGDNGTAHFLQQVDVGTSNLHNVVGNGGWGPAGPTTPAQDAHGTAVGYIQGMAFGGGGVFWADSAKSCVWRYDLSTKAVTLVAGTPVVGQNGTVADGDGNPYGYSGDNGPGKSAAFRTPSAVAVDTAGNVFIADSGNNRIRKVSAADGTVTTVAGTGTAGLAADGTLGTAADLQGLSLGGLAVDAAGNLYFGDRVANVVRVLKASDRTVATIAGGGTQDHTVAGPALSARFTAVTSLALGANGTQLYVSDDAAHVVRRIDLAAKTIRTVAGTGTAGYSGDGGPAAQARLNKPSGLFAAPDGDLYIVEYANGTVRRVSNL